MENLIMYCWYMMLCVMTCLQSSAASVLVMKYAETVG